MINAFINKKIYLGNLERDVYWDEEPKEGAYLETIAERTKMRRQNQEQQDK